MGSVVTGGLIWWSAPSVCRGTDGCTAPAEVLAGLAGAEPLLGALMVTVRGRSCSRRVPVGGRGVAVSVVPGWGAGRVGSRGHAG